MTDSNNYVIGRGKLYFDAFTAGTLTMTGERYLGNTPTLESTIANTDLKHYSSESGLKVMDQSVTLQKDITLQFSTDNVSAENLAFWYSGGQQAVTQTGTTGQTDTLVVSPGLWYQLGRTEENPLGVYNLGTDTVITHGTHTLDGTLDFVLDVDHGRFQVLDTGTVADGDTLVAHYSFGTAEASVIVTAGTELYGALNFLSDNPVGENADHYWPYVKLTATGNFALKGDNWQEMTFQAEVLLPPDGRQRVYVRQRAA